MKPARPEDIPKATREGEQMLFGVRVRSYRLDNGMSVIHADDFNNLLEALGLTLEDLDKMAGE